MPRQWGTIVLCCVLASVFGMAPWAWPAEPAPPAAGQIVVTVIGSSRIDGDNVGAARNRAISNGLVAAIAQASATLFPRNFQVEHFTTLNQMLYNQSGKFVLDYKVLTEAASHPNYRVMVEATISMDMLRQFLANAHLLPEIKSFPRILLLIAEQNLEDAAPHFWWGGDTAFLESACENQLSQVLKDQGFILIDHTASPPPGPEGEGASPVVLPEGPNPTDAEALALAKRYGADMVVVALATAKSSGNVMGETYRSFKGEFTGRALRVDTGKTIATLDQSAVAMASDAVTGSRQALKDVGTSAAEALGPQLTAAWQVKSDEPLSVSMEIQGTGKLANFVKFRNLLQDLPMVVEVETTEIRPNEASLSLQLKGSPQALADALMLKTFDTFGIHISEITANALSLTLVPK